MSRFYVKAFRFANKGQCLMLFRASSFPFQAFTEVLRLILSFPFSPLLVKGLCCKVQIGMVG